MNDLNDFTFDRIQIKNFMKEMKKRFGSAWETFMSDEQKDDAWATQVLKVLMSQNNEALAPAQHMVKVMLGAFKNIEGGE